MTLLDDLMDSLTVERIAAELERATTPAELIMVWWDKADAKDGQSRKLLQAVYQKRLMKLTGALS